MNKQQERHIIASAGTVLFMLVVFLLLWLVCLTAVQPDEPEGVEVAFGELAEAGGYMDRQSESVPIPSPQSSSPQPASAPSDNEMLTQEDEESLAYLRRQEEAEKSRRQAEADRLQREREEQARLEAERKAKEAEEAERKAKEAEAIAKANAMGSLFGSNSTNAQGSGDSQGAGQKGNPVVGHGSVGGNEWSLSGRNARAIPKPANTFNQDGKVIVRIRVNAAGQVISATHNGGTISDKQTIQLALEAARKASFTEGKHDQIGTITYTFKFN